MKALIMIAALGMLMGCGTRQIPRTKFSDKNMRVMVYHENLPADEFVRLHSSVISANAFAVIDRSTGFRAIKQEQERLHRSMVDRFDDRQKFAHWGKMYGVGSVIVGHIQCSRKFHRWSGGAYQECYQALNMVDTNTGEIILGVESKPFALGYSETSDWSDLVEKLVDTYPRAFTEFKKHRKLLEYEDLSKEEAVRQKEELAQQQVRGE